MQAGARCPPSAAACHPVGFPFQPQKPTTFTCATSPARTLARMHADSSPASPCSAPCLPLPPPLACLCPKQSLRRGRAAAAAAATAAPPARTPPPGPAPSPSPRLATASAPPPRPAAAAAAAASPRPRQAAGARVLVCIQRLGVGVGSLGGRALSCAPLPCRWSLAEQLPAWRRFVAAHLSNMLTHRWLAWRVPRPPILCCRRIRASRSPSGSPSGLRDYALAQVGEVSPLGACVGSGEAGRGNWPEEAACFASRPNPRATLSRSPAVPGRARPCRARLTAPHVARGAWPSGPPAAAADPARPWRQQVRRPLLCALLASCRLRATLPLLALRFGSS